MNQSKNNDDIMSALVEEELELIAAIVTIERKHVYGAPGSADSKRQKEIADFLESYVSRKKS